MNILIVSRLCRLRGSALESAGSGLVGGGIYRQIVSAQTALQETAKVQVGDEMSTMLNIIVLAITMM
jgi:hypothetical protein